MDRMENDLILNLDKLHTTKMGIDRVKRNLGLDVPDVVQWCRDSIKSSSASIERKGKNWYAVIGNYRITVHARSYTIITAHKISKLA